MKQFDVGGMMCAACSARVEKVVSQVPGVTSCSVSLLTNSMGVEGTASDEEIIKAVVDAGYEASVKAGAGASTETKSDAEYSSTSDPLADREIPLLKKRLITSLIFLLPLLYITMGHMLWNFPLPAFLAENHSIMGLVQLVLTLIIMIINKRFFTSGIKSAIHLAPNMDTLVALGAGTSFIYSVWVLIAITFTNSSTARRTFFSICSGGTSLSAFNASSKRSVPNISLSVFSASGTPSVYRKSLSPGSSCRS